MKIVSVVLLTLALSMAGVGRSVDVVPSMSMGTCFNYVDGFPCGNMIDGDTSTLAKSASHGSFADVNLSAPFSTGYIDILTATNPECTTVVSRVDMFNDGAYLGTVQFESNFVAIGFPSWTRVKIGRVIDRFDVVQVSSDCPVGYYEVRLAATGGSAPGIVGVFGMPGSMVFYATQVFISQDPLIKGLTIAIVTLGVVVFAFNGFLGIQEAARDKEQASIKKRKRLKKMGIGSEYTVSFPDSRSDEEKRFDAINDVSTEIDYD